MENLALELFALIVRDCDLRAILALYRTCHLFRLYIPGSVRYVRSTPILAKPELTDLLLSFPHLRSIEGVVLSLRPTLGVNHITHIPANLAGATFLCPVSPLLLVQRLMDIDEKFLSRAWIFATKHENGLSWSAIYRGRARALQPELRSYLALAVEKGEFMPHPLTSEIFEHGSLGHVRPMDPSSPLLKDALEGCSEALRSDAFLLFLALLVEYSTVGRDSPLIARWLGIGSCSTARTDTGRRIFVHLQITMACLARLRVPSPTKGDHPRHLAAIEAVKAHYCQHREGVFGGLSLALRVDQDFEQLVKRFSPHLADYLTYFPRTKRAHAPVEVGERARSVLLPRIEQAQAKDKVLDVSKMYGNGYGTRLINRPSTRSKKKGRPPCLIVSDNEYNFRAAIEILGPGYAAWMGCYP